MTESPQWSNVTVSLSVLSPWEHNPRQMTKAQAKRLLKSWQTLGQFQTIAIGPGGEVYDGHQRLNALLAAHGPQYQIEARQSDRALNDDERAALTLAANIPAGSWDWDKLSQWDAEAVKEWGLNDDTLKAWNNDSAALGTMLGVESNYISTDESDPSDKMTEAEKLIRDKQRNATQVIFCIGMSTTWLERDDNVALVERLLSSPSAGEIAQYVIEKVLERYG